MGSPQLGNHDMNQMGGFSSGFNTNTTTSYNKQNFGQSYHKDTNEVIILSLKILINYHQ